MNKIKSFVFSEKKLSKAIFGFLILAAFAFIFGPNVYAQFARQTGDAAGWGYGYGYGYGSGYGTDDGAYRIDGGAADNYEYDYGYGNRAVVQLTISTPTLTTTKVYNGSTSAAVTAGTLSGVVSGEVVTVTAVATYNSETVGTGKTITVVYTLAGADAANYTAPIDYSTTGTITASNGGGGGGGSYSPTCTDVTYGDYSTACFGSFNFRPVTSRTPNNCTLTAAQQAATQRNCITGSVYLPVTDVTGVGLTKEAENSANFIAREKNLVKKINKALARRLAGRILLQVQEHGEAWYVNPLNDSKYFMGRPADAFAIMRKLALGISNKDFASYKNNTAPARLAGRILLKVEDNGKAYYINPLNLKMYYLGRPDDAFSIMRSLGLGITNDDLRQIEVREAK